MNSFTTDLLVFQVGRSTFTAPLNGVAHIESIRDLPDERIVRRTIIGDSFHGGHGIAIEGEKVLIVDRVIGIRTIAEQDCHALPPFAFACLASRAVTGIVFLDGDPTLLLDLQALVREQTRSEVH